MPHSSSRPSEPQSASINSKLSHLLMALLVLLLAGCASGPRTSNNKQEDRLRVRFWPLPKFLSDFPEMSLRRLQDRKSFGVAFHGGGNRAAPSALGQLRMLHKLGWIDDVRYISSISGGSWVSIPYTYQQDCDSTSEQHFLGNRRRCKRAKANGIRSWNHAERFGRKSTFWKSSVELGQRTVR